MVRKNRESPLAAALGALPLHIADAVRAAVGLYEGRCDEIRLSRGGQAYITVAGRNVRTGVVCTAEDIKQTVGELCGHSLYAHSDTIREGFIFTETGLRVGVCGRAVCRDGRVELVSDITSVSIRIPNRYIGAADDLFSIAAGNDCPKGMLIWSAPGVGKTTVLRELAVLLAGGDAPLRTAVIDTRYELTAGVSGGMMDIFLGYPRAVGMELAVRTMSPQIVICDEISGQADADAVRSCASAGIAVIASAHAGSVSDLLARQELHGLIEDGVFSTLVGLSRVKGQITHSVTDAHGEVIPCCV